MKGYPMVDHLGKMSVALLVYSKVVLKVEETEHEKVAARDKNLDKHLAETSVVQMDLLWAVLMVVYWVGLSVPQSVAMKARLSGHWMV